MDDNIRDGAREPDEPEEDAASEEEAGKAGERFRMELYDWLQCIVSAVLCGIFVFIFIGRPIGVDGESMMSTLYDTDRVIMSNLFFTPKYGDIVVFRSPAFEQPLVKRVIAVAGQTIDIDFKTGEVTVDDRVLDEPYINAVTHTRDNFSGPLTVPEGFIFVMGDNRNDSADSRSSRVGLVDTRYILGKVLLIAIPGENEHVTRQWSRVGSVYR